MKKTLWPALAVVAVVVAFFVYQSTHAPEPTPGEKILEKITIAQTGDFLLYSVLYLAEDAGFFEENGLDVTIVSTGGDEKSVAAVIAKQAQFGVGDPTFAAIAKERG